MKRAISISLGSSQFDKRVEITLKGEKILVERIGTDGDIESLIDELEIRPTVMRL